MFDLGFQELVVIFVVALLVFGPKRIPELSRALGKGLRELKIALHGVKESIEEVGAETEQVEKELSEGISRRASTRQEEPEKAEQNTESLNIGAQNAEEKKGKDSV